MKIKLLQNVRGQLPTQSFFKGRIYDACVATNQTGAFRLSKLHEVKVNKVFVEKGQKRSDIDTLLLNKGDFEVISLVKKEREELIQNYLSSKIKAPREKLLVPRGFVLREGFRPVTDKEQTNPKTSYCFTNTATDGRCRQLTQFIKDLGKVRGKNVKVCACLKHATVRVK